MAEGLQVQSKVENRVILLTVRFSQELLLEGDAGERLSQELTRRYREIRDEKREEVETTSCVVEIQSEIAGSALVLALFELWREVVAKESGQVICVNYPPDYIDSLTSLGLPALQGFSLAGSKEDAFLRIKK